MDKFYPIVFAVKSIIYKIFFFFTMIVIIIIPIEPRCTVGVSGASIARAVR